MDPVPIWLALTVNFGGTGTAVPYHRPQQLLIVFPE